MATNFPTSLDSLTNPTSSDSLNSPSHSAQHANVNDAVEALQAKVGADSSAVTSSLDYKVAQLEARNLAGLVPITTTTVGTAVSSVTISDCFSADYDDYLIRWSGGVGSANTDMQLRVGGVTTQTYAWAAHYVSYSAGAETIVNEDVGGGGGSEKVRYMGWVNSAFAHVEATIRGPFLTRNTFFWSPFVIDSVSGRCGGYLDDTSSHTSVTVLPNSGTITGGTITVYGYAKA